MEYDIVHAILCGDERISDRMLVMIMRKYFVYRHPRALNISSDVVADALHMDRSSVKESWSRIKSKWRMVYMTKSELVKRFGKRRLLDIAEELEIDGVEDSLHVYKVIGAIDSDLEENGIPDWEISEELFDYLVAKGYITDDGEVIDYPDDDAEPEPEEVKLPEKLPGCWGQAESEDPSCKKCPIRVPCTRMRTESRPVCYGALYDESHPDCKGCMEWKECKEESK
jgi:hypothetical protein